MSVTSKFKLFTALPPSLIKPLILLVVVLNLITTASLSVPSFIDILLKVKSSASAAISAYKTPSVLLKVFAFPALVQVSATRVPVTPAVGM